METIDNGFRGTSAVFSYPDIEDAIDYAVNSVVLEPSEIGVEIYGELFEEKVFEFLSQKFELNE